MIVEQEFFIYLIRYYEYTFFYRNICNGLQFFRQVCCPGRVWGAVYYHGLCGRCYSITELLRGYFKGILFPRRKYYWCCPCYGHHRRVGYPIRGRYNYLVAFFKKCLRKVKKRLFAAAGYQYLFPSISQIIIPLEFFYYGVLELVYSAHGSIFCKT